MCDCPKHQDEAAACTCICDAHANFEAARDLAMSRYHAIRSIERELEKTEIALERERGKARDATERAEAAEKRLRDIESIAEGHIGEIAAGELPPPLFS